MKMKFAEEKTSLLSRVERSLYIFEEVIYA